MYLVPAFFNELPNDQRPLLRNSLPEASSHLLCVMEHSLPIVTRPCQQRWRYFSETQILEIGFPTPTGLSLQPQGPLVSLAEMQYEKINY